MSYLEKAVEISTAPENCEGDNWGDLINLCGEADTELDKTRELYDGLQAENKNLKTTIQQLIWIAEKADTDDSEDTTIELARSEVKK